MADSNVELNPGTGGELVDTITTSDGDHRQVVALAGTEDDSIVEPALANGVRAVPVTSQKIVALLTEQRELLKEIRDLLIEIAD